MGRGQVARFISWHEGEGAPEYAERVFWRAFGSDIEQVISMTVSNGVTAEWEGKTCKALIPHIHITPLYPHPPTPFAHPPPVKSRPGTVEGLQAIPFMTITPRPPPTHRPPYPPSTPHLPPIIIARTCGRPASPPSPCV